VRSSAPSNPLDAIGGRGAYFYGGGKGMGKGKEGMGREEGKGRGGRGGEGRTPVPDWESAKAATLFSFRVALSRAIGARP